MQMLYPCSEVKNPYKGFTSCTDTAYCRVRIKSQFKVATWFAATWVWFLERKGLPLLLQIQISMFAQYFTLFSSGDTWKYLRYFFLGQKESTSASISLYTTSCKIPLSLKHHHRCCLCPLDYSPLPGKLFLITNFLLLFLLAVPTLVCATWCNVSLEMQLLSRLLLWAFDASKRNEAAYLGTTSAILKPLRAAHNFICCL